MQNFTTREGWKRKERKKKTPPLEDSESSFGGGGCTSKLEKEYFFWYLVSYVRYDGMPMRGIHVGIVPRSCCTLSPCQRLQLISAEFVSNTPIGGRKVELLYGATDAYTTEPRGSCKAFVLVVVCNRYNTRHRHGGPGK